ncbi:TIGR03032 family protein [Bradyrhizobium sp.]|uniref:TIGR03032 family protein n=1 Tax=Bradyrhizobium sp. TaxID=376 RepID=UPI003C5F1B0F
MQFVGTRGDAAERQNSATSRSSPGPDEPKRSFNVQTEFSRGFGDWLIDQQVALVCSTYLTGYLLFIGVRADGMPVPSAASFSHAMGLVADSQRIYLGTKNEIWRLENILRPDELANEMFDRFYAPRTAQITGDINIHEMGVDASGDLLFINTRHSCLATISATHAFKPLWKPKFISRLAPEDRCHLNGLAMENGRARYVTACSTGDVLESWRGGRRDAGVVIDLETDAVVADGFSMPHSPRIWGDSVYLLESGRGYLVRIDRHSGKREDVTFCPGFARGMVFVSHYAVVTVSLSRHANFGGLPIDATMKANGAAPRCGLLVIDLRSGNIVQWFRFRGDVTELFDVGVISNIRCPRGIGPNAPGLEEAMRGEELATSRETTPPLFTRSTGDE